ncbi:biotin-dependent carboxyltransferase family protein [Shewanella sp. AS1]|uniref:5-oxoprolinase subunit C family protein n=1 Tax=Shewanella sp. AS1 TaxID=2907626 RepID=UPI001F411F90|nr:biotin-dependent carboxyltransferase family protein [Shewanella sp. AS1]MCE9678443.1 biotin-dependent carboxyltransferase family protein [Shewanella sp. AS1]
MALNIITPGPLSLIQDLGRFGYQSIGVSPGGPMDEHAFRWANRLLDNDPNAAQIEVTMGQFSCEFTAETCFSITGADMGAMLNAKAIAPWHTYVAKAGDKLSLRGARSGMRSYLALKGGFKLPAPLGSCATVMRDQLGGASGLGEKLKAGDRLDYGGHSRTTHSLSRSVPYYFIPHYSQKVTLEVIPSYQYDEFTPEQSERFFGSTYTLTPQMDRMGARLAGEAIECKRNNLISEGIALGSIQIPPDGQPIILLRDRQTIGGYPKIGCVTVKSLNRLAQCLPGAEIRFVEKDPLQAQIERRTELLFFHAYVGKGSKKQGVSKVQDTDK